MGYLREAFVLLHQYKMMLNPTKCTFSIDLEKFLSFIVSQRGIEANMEKIKVIMDMKPPRTLVRHKD